MNKREKELADKEIQLVDNEIQLYKREKLLAVNEEVQQKVKTNWEQVQAVRHDSYKRRAELEIETAKLEAKKEALIEVAVIKDKQIDLLKGLLTEAIKALQTIKTAA